MASLNLEKEISIPYKCKGGPYHGQFLYLTTQTTLDFKVGDWQGHYSPSTLWKEKDTHLVWRNKHES